MAKGHTQPVHAPHRHISRTRHHELVAVDVVGLGGVVSIGVDTCAFVRLACGELAEVLVGELQVLRTKGHGTDGELGVHGDVQAFKVAVIDGQAGRAAMPKGHTQPVHTPNHHISRARHGELIAGTATAVGFRDGVIRAGINTRATVTGAGWELAGVLVDEFQVLGTKADRTHSKAGVDNDVQAFQVAVDDDQAGRGTMPKAHTELRHATHRHVARAGHGKLVLGGVIRAGVGAGAGIEGLTGIGVLELQILNAERDGTDHETGVDRGIQNHQVPVGNHQARVGTMPEPDTQAIDAAHVQRGRSGHRKQVGGFGVLEPHAVKIKIDRTDAGVRFDRQIQVHQRTVLYHQAGSGGGHPRSCRAVAKEHADVSHTAHRGRCRAGQREQIGGCNIGEPQAFGGEIDLADIDVGIDGHIE